MEGLINYGSDDDYDNSPQHLQPSDTYKVESNPQQDVSKERLTSKGKDAFYEDTSTNMDYDEHQEEKRKSSSSKSRAYSPSQTPPRTLKPTEESIKTTEHDGRNKSRKSSKERRRRSRSRSASRSKSKSRSQSRSPHRSSRREEKHSKRHRRTKEETEHAAKRKDNYRRRSRSTDRKHREYKDSCRSDPQRSNGDRGSRNSRDAYKESSRDVNREYPGDNFRDRYNRRFDRASNKLAHLEKMGIDVNKSQHKNKDASVSSANSTSSDVSVQNKASESRLLPACVTGRLREQMERRKALWQKKEPEAATASQCIVPTVPNNSGKVWESTTFAHDQEGKQANKFKRLMGIREGPASGNDKADSLAKKQEEMFSSMEQQYEVARTATHTMRGVGLGFSSYQQR